jgi:hypothetical protein
MNQAQVEDCGISFLQFTQRGLSLRLALCAGSGDSSGSSGAACPQRGPRHSNWCCALACLPGMCLQAAGAADRHETGSHLLGKVTTTGLSMLVEELSRELDLFRKERQSLGSAPWLPAYFRKPGSVGLLPSHTAVSATPAVTGRSPFQSSGGLPTRARPLRFTDAREGSRTRGILPRKHSVACAKLMANHKNHGVCHGRSRKGMRAADEALQGLVACQRCARPSATKNKPPIQFQCYNYIIPGRDRKA